MFFEWFYMVLLTLVSTSIVSILFFSFMLYAPQMMDFLSLLLVFFVWGSKFLSKKNAFHRIRVPNYFPSWWTVLCILIFLFFFLPLHFVQSQISLLLLIGDIIFIIFIFSNLFLKMIYRKEKLKDLA